MQAGDCNRHTFSIYRKNKQTTTLCTLQQLVSHCGLLVAGQLRPCLLSHRQRRQAEHGSAGEPRVTMTLIELSHGRNITDCFVHSARVSSRPREAQNGGITVLGGGGREGFTGQRWFQCHPSRLRTEVFTPPVTRRRLRRRQQSDQ